MLTSTAVQMKGKGTQTKRRHPPRQTPQLNKGDPRKGKGNKKKGILATLAGSLAALCFCCGTTGAVEDDTSEDEEADPENLPLHGSEHK